MNKFFDQTKFYRQSNLHNTLEPPHHFLAISSRHGAREQVSHHFQHLKVHLTPNIFFAKTNPLVIWSIWAKKFWIWLNPRFSIFDVPFKVAAEVLHDRVSGSLGRRLLMTSTQEPNTMAPQSALCICSRKWQTKLIVPIYFRTKTSKFFQNHFFFVTGVRVGFRFGRNRNKLRSSTFDNCEVTA